MRQICIENVITEILVDYGNRAYLNKTHTSSFDEVRGTALWKLWYGESLTDFCVRTLKYEHKKARLDASLMPAFEAKLIKLLDSLKEEFSKLERRTVYESG